MSAKLPYRALLCYSIVVVYGSFIPYIFNFDPNFARWRLGVFLSDSLYRGLTYRSWSDILVNVLIYLPLGALGVASLRRSRWFGRSLVTPLVVGTVGLCVGLAVELGQTLAPYRSPSMLDAFCNGIGTLTGAYLGYFLSPPRAVAFRLHFGRFARTHPAQLVGGTLLIASIAGNYYPFIAIRNFATWRLRFARGLATYLWPATFFSWLDIVFEKGLIYGALGFALHQILRPSGRAGALWVGFIAAGAASLIEGGKLFFIVSSFRLADLLVSAAGALCGATVVPKLLSLDTVRSRRYAILLAILVAVLVYFELRPFDWIYAVELSPELKRIEWAPFISYYSSPPAAAFFDLATKLLLTFPLGYLIATVTPTHETARRVSYAAVFATCIGILLEACQLAIRSRFTSMTDVLIFTFGAWIGAVAYNWFYSSTTLAAEQITVENRWERKNCL
jgi:VanZ family protein